MLVNFFKNLFPIKNLFQMEKTPPAYYSFKKLSKLNSQNKDKPFYTYLYFLTRQRDGNTLLHECLKNAINYDDLPLIKKLYPYMKENHDGLMHDRQDYLLFEYAKIAMEADKIDIFDYFVGIYHDKYPGLAYSASYGPNSFSDLIISMIENKNLPYFNVLEKHRLFSCHDFLESSIFNRNYFTNKNNEVLNFMLENFPVGAHPEKEDLFSKTIDINKIFVSACRSPYTEEKLIINLVSLGADVNYKKQYPINQLIRREQTEMVKFLFQKGAKFDLKYVDKGNSLYPWIEKWIESKGLFDELSSEIGNNEIAVTKHKKNKL
jgi:hypothetical protein